MGEENTASPDQLDKTLQKLINEETLWLSTDDRGRTTVHLSSRSHPPKPIAIRLPREREGEPPSPTGWLPPHSGDDSYRLGLVQTMVGSRAKLKVTEGVYVGVGGAEISWTPLRITSRGGYRPLLGLLFGDNFKVDNQDSRVGELIRTASEHGHEEIVRFLIERGADVGLPCEYAWMPLHSASGRGHVEIVKLLLENGADPTIVGYGGCTPLASASSNGDARIVRLLLDKGAVVSMNIANSLGGTPLHIAADQGHTELVRLLLEYGANISAIDRRGRTALYMASYGGQIETVRLLVNQGADLSAADENGWTPLHCAAENCQLEVVKFLVDRGADVSAVDKNERAPIQCAWEMGHYHVVWFFEKGA